ncbi:DEAD/DEAH box helicase [Phocaeicola sp.]|uniref:DEAD/DEAH box helicase n=1 Tax=Phocaeicola sp. TaxID=2773926 RepID=UPI0023C6138B|nr:DEAD/DEAH box helicase [Phocaeicola sp.]MDE5676236.1 DEAD/DEAH box helicase [Phocaeicola sp.]
MTKAMRLYDYQSRMMLRLAEEWKVHRSVMVQMPTGTGKTHILACVVKEKLECTDGGVWIVVHRRELVAQIEETVGRYGIGREDGRVKVMSIQWLARHWDDVDGEPGTIVIDEAHHAVAETYREMWNRWPKAGFLGLTATPCRMNGRGFADLFDTLVTSWSIAEFIEKGYLSAFDYVSIRRGSEEQRLIGMLEKRGADGDYQIKEMNRVLNRDTSIGRLYRSMERFARGKKGIVYAISIDHARHIAEYYSRRGVDAVPIDSRTPPAERRKMVEDFKAGRIKVMVNVDIFSEGFDCPDVEFVQMARPTLSLAKYLQQAGRGLRRTEGKEACVLIDNVGLYRVFGLPTVAWDWGAMFRGLMLGKGRPVAEEAGNDRMPSCFGAPAEEPATDCDMEVIISHEQLLAGMGQPEEARVPQADAGGLKAWQDGSSGLWGLKRGRRRLTDVCFDTVFDVRYDMAAVRFVDMACGVVDASGKVIWKKNRYVSLKFLKNRMLYAALPYDGKACYLDLCSLRAYDRKPEIKRYEGVELLKIGKTYYSRTRTVYMNNRGIDKSYIARRDFYLTIYDHKIPLPRYDKLRPLLDFQCGHVCLLDGDDERYYWLYGRLDDGSIVVRDTRGRYYHAEDGHAASYIGCEDSEHDFALCRMAMDRLAGRAAEKILARKAEREENLRRWLETDRAVPFKSGLKWGLKLCGRVVVPPVYRNVQQPVGMYCAVEKNYGQWGVILVDGTVLIEPAYAAVSIGDNGTALLTYVTGKQVSVKLH